MKTRPATKFLVFSFLIQSTFFWSSMATAQTATAPGLKFDALIDAYYAYDLNSLPNFDRMYTTQPARSDEFNLNLASLGASYAADRVRGRLALQAGTSVQSNYSAEPSIGSVSGPSLSRSIQEGYVGYRLTDSVWIDAGTYFSHVGGESWVSRDNFTYTRSWVADFSPYYQSGVRVSYQANEQFSFQFHVVNGWQIVSENNHSKMVGTQVSYQPNSKSTFSYNTLAGREAEFRHFHDFVYKYVGDTVDVLLQYDVGFQTLAQGSGAGNWWGTVGVLRYKFLPSEAVSLRAEHYSDPRQFIVATSRPDGFEATGFSIGYDRDLANNLKWRSEYRLLLAQTDLFPDGAGFSPRESFVVTSLTLSL